MVMVRAKKKVRTKKGGGADAGCRSFRPVCVNSHLVENGAQGKTEVATEEEGRAGADDHYTEQVDDKVRVRAHRSEARDGRSNTDAQQAVTLDSNT